MIYVYRQEGSAGARELADGFTNANARKIRDLRQPHFNTGLRAGDVLVCWGEQVQGVPEGVKVLNGGPIRSKFDEAVALTAARVPTIQVSRTRPTPQQQVVVPQEWDDLPDLRDGARQFAAMAFDRTGPVYRDCVVELAREFRRLQEFLATAPAPPRPLEVWLARRNNHVGGSDLLNPPNMPDFYSKKLDIVDEFRIHSFLGRSIRAGKKVPRTDFTGRRHEWVRSFDAGWRIDYEGFESTGPMRELAKSAVEALGLQFGAVDIGQLRDGSLVVLEVNRAPGIEGGTVTQYVNAIQRWITEGDAPRQTRRRATTR